MKKFNFILALIATLSFSVIAQTKKPAPKPAAKAPVTSSATAMKTAIPKGKAVYMTYCVACHQADGGGVPNMNPSLIKAADVNGDKSKLIRVILKGMQNVEIDGETYSNVMPPHNFLTDQQIADVLTYVRNSFTNKASLVSAAEVKAVRAKTK